MGVKQGCVLAPLLFNVFLLAVTILCSRQAEREEERQGVHLTLRCDGGAFRIQRFRAQRKTESIIVRDLQYADDAAIVTNNANELQHELEMMDEHYARLGLQMKTRKTEMLHRLTDSATAAQPTSIRGNTLKGVQDFIYLSSIISSKSSLNREISNHISRISAEFGQLAGKV